MGSGEIRRHGVFCGSRLPPIITSEGNSLRIEFLSDNSVQKSGFAAVFFTGIYHVIITYYLDIINIAPKFSNSKKYLIIRVACFRQRWMRHKQWWVSAHLSQHHWILLLLLWPRVRTAREQSWLQRRWMQGNNVFLMYSFIQIISLALTSLSLNVYTAAWNWDYEWRIIESKISWLLSCKERLCMDIQHNSWA